MRKENTKNINYFDRKLVGGAISQKGINYQIIVCIKYIFDFLNDINFKSISIEQYDDFAINMKDNLILCQVKSVCFNMSDVRIFINEHCDEIKKRILICSAFTNDVCNLITKRMWLEQYQKIEPSNYEIVLKEYQNEIAKYNINYDNFINIKLDTISYNEAETIAKNTINEWSKENAISINTEKLFTDMYREISKLGSSRGSLLKERINELINQCIETENTIFTSLDVMENKDLNNTRQIYYIKDSKDNKNNIFIPKLKYWDDILLYNKPMIPLNFDEEPFDSVMPCLDIKVLNNSSKLLLLDELIIEVISSNPDPSPLLYINGNKVNDYARQIELNNAGWGKIKNLNIKINCNTNYCENFDEFYAEEYIGDFIHTKNVDLTKMLHKITKIDFENFEQEYYKFYENSIECQAMQEKILKKYLGEYSSGKAYVNGIIDFYSDTIEECDKHFTLKFSCLVNLYLNILGGAYFSPSYQYDIELPAEGSNYVVKKCISQKIEPNGADRFNLKIHCEKSSRHLFNIYLQDISKKRIEVEKNVQLNICNPRSAHINYG